MKDVQIVLRHKQQDLDRVRQEIQALLIVIPLLTDDQFGANDVIRLLEQAVAERRSGMADLEDYYPLVRAMRMSERR